MIDPAAPRFGLPPSLWVPIAAASIADIETYVGHVLRSVVDPASGRVNAALVESSSPGAAKETNVPLWKSPLASSAEQRLHALKQVWVHVDYPGYRQAYIQFAMPPIPPDYFLDHVQNRIAIRRRGYSHPYLRLCPVHRRVNTSGGHSFGGEGMEKEFIASHGAPPSPNKIIYADPMDLTKMLDIAPGYAGSRWRPRYTAAILSLNHRHHRRVAPVRGAKARPLCADRRIRCITGDRNCGGPHCGGHHAFIVDKRGSRNHAKSGIVPGSRTIAITGQDDACR